MSELAGAFFEDLARVEDDLRVGARAALTDQEIPAWVPDPAPVRVLRQALVTPEQIEAFASFVADVAHIALHTALTTIDGGSASAEVGTVQLVDAAGQRLSDDLALEFVDHLLDTGRMT